jgi:hypothetical protein
MKSFSEGMQMVYGAAGMQRPPTRKELYEALDIIQDALYGHRDRLIEQKDEISNLRASLPKPKVRVPAGSERT